MWLAKTRYLPAILGDECGQDSVEYAIMIGIVAVAVIGSVGTLSSYVSSVFNTYATTL